MIFLCAAALVSAGYSGPPNYGYDPAVSSESQKSQGTFGPVASNSGLKVYNGPTVSPVPGAFTATTKNGNPVSIPSYPPLQYSTTKSNAVSYPYTSPTAAYPTQYAGVTDYPASYSSQNNAQYPQAYSQAYPQTQTYQAYPQGYTQAYQQTVPQPYAYPSQVALSGYQTYQPTQYQSYPTQYQAYQAPAQYPYSAQYPGYPAGYPSVQYSPTPVVQYSAAPVQYAAAPVQYSAVPVQYSPAPAVSHVQYSGSDGSYSWKKK